MSDNRKAVHHGDEHNGTEYFLHCQRRQERDYSCG